MRTKDEIIAPLWFAQMPEMIEASLEPKAYSIEQLRVAMDQYAKEEGIGFLEWVRFKWKNTYNLLWEEIRDDFENTRVKDSAELYEMYLQERSSLK